MQWPTCGSDRLARTSRAPSSGSLQVRTPITQVDLSSNPLQRTIIRGLLRSDHIIKFISDIPCDIIHDLENDANKAERFVKDLEKGKVPDLIEDLPKEAIGAFKDVVGIFQKLPTQIKYEAEAAVTEAAKVFNDIGTGAIVSDIARLPHVVVSDVTSAWGDLTSGLKDGWNAATDAFACLIHDCTINTNAPSSCRGSGARTASVSRQAVTSHAVVTSHSVQRLTTVALTTSTPRGASPARTSILNGGASPTKPSVNGGTPPIAASGTTESAGTNTASAGSSVAASSKAEKLTNWPHVIQLSWLAGLVVAGLAFQL